MCGGAAGCCNHTEEKRIMNGPKHYQEAERRLGVGINLNDPAVGTVAVLSALTHAVLALCAAHVENDYEVGRTPEELERWVTAGAVEDVEGTEPAP
jgi:hypothetical protein